jgi:uncharacterized protein (DUF1499 family)
MTITTIPSSARRSLFRKMPFLGLALAAIAFLLLAAGPIGWRAGWLHYRFGLQTLTPWAGYFGVAALIVSAASLLLTRWRTEWRRIVVAVIAFAAGGLVAYVPWHYDAMRQTVPRINDITTDTENPPRFVAITPLRAAEGANPVTYQSEAFGQQQKRAYPDIAPLVMALPPAAAFDLALDTARAMGWRIVATDNQAGRIEASDRSRWYGFTDDIVIRVAASGSGSRVDLRSSARLGRGDFGVNAARVRAYLAALRSTAGSALTKGE